MAKTTYTMITDDIDGSDDAETISFSYKGTEYSIDLAEKNAAKFDKAITPFIEKATKVSGRKTSAAKTSAAGKRGDLADIRAWAKDNGYEVSDRGRISAEVVSAYDAAS